MIQTARCNLTRLREDDFEHITTLRTNEEVRRFLGGPAPKDSIRSRFSEMLKPDASVHQWVIRERTDSSFIGLVTLDQHHNKVDTEVSYELLPEWWGKGYATEAVQAVIDYAFDDLKLMRIVAETQTVNTASLRLLERLGMSFEQTVERFGAEQAIYAIGK